MSFARTIDTFQGQTAGPTEPRRPPHDVECVILDPGTRAFEARGKTGIAYTMISRGTTIGTLDDRGTRMNSAIYFHDFGLGISGIPLSANRLAELRGPVGSPDKPYNAILRRDRWVQFLESNCHDSGLHDSQIDFLIDWATSTRITPERVDRWIGKLKYAFVPDVP